MTEIKLRSGVKCTFWDGAESNSFVAKSNFVHNNNWAIINIGGTVYWIGGTKLVDDFTSQGALRIK